MCFSKYYILQQVWQYCAQLAWRSNPTRRLSLQACYNPFRTRGKPHNDGYVTNGNWHRVGQYRHFTYHLRKKRTCMRRLESCSWGSSIEPVAHLTWPALPFLTRSRFWKPTWKPGFQVGQWGSDGAALVNSISQLASSGFLSDYFFAQ